MAAQDFYKLKEAEKIEVYTAAAQQKGLPLYAVEKGWWVLYSYPRHGLYLPSKVLFSKFNIKSYFNNL